MGRSKKESCKVISIDSYLYERIPCKCGKYHSEEDESTFTWKKIGIGEEVSVMVCKKCKRTIMMQQLMTFWG